jgi:orotate phosphoribosyltransferase-like protein
VKAFIRQGRCLTIGMIADELHINECTVYQIVTQDLNMRKHSKGSTCPLHILYYQSL